MMISVMGYQAVKQLYLYFLVNHQRTVVKLGVVYEYGSTIILAKESAAQPIIILVGGKPAT